VNIPAAWYVACFSADLGDRPVARTVSGTPMALFRAGGKQAVAVLDRCPHRNVPLSCGAVRDGLLECCYHGWRFDASGTCRAIPGLLDGDGPDRRARRVPSFPVVEQDGLVWVQPSPGDGAAGVPPVRLAHLHEAGYSTVRRHVRFQAGLHACLENALDVPHTAFLHGGLFRGGRDPVEIEVVVRDRADGVEAEYVGEPRPSGWVGRVLAPEGGVVTHVDRFLLPSVAQVEYRLGLNHLLDTALFTPVSEDETDLHAVISFRLRLPHGVIRPLITPIVNRILAQDATILRRQAENTRRFGGEQHASTELDVLGQHIRKLLRQAARGDVPAAAGGHAGDGHPVERHGAERRIRMRV
jgi:phenylpropionate dioxygenase-like ring-hydroxylating dioxygenase large terminal subunit